MGKDFLLYRYPTEKISLLIMIISCKNSFFFVYEKNNLFLAFSVRNPKLKNMCNNEQ